MIGIFESIKAWFIDIFEFGKMNDVYGYPPVLDTKPDIKPTNLCDSKRVVLNKLLNNGETQREDYDDGFRLSARIHDLRAIGYDIRSVRIDPWNKRNRRKKYILVDSE